jgi:hypothetical protein
MVSRHNLIELNGRRNTFAITLAALNMNSKNKKYVYEINYSTVSNHRSGRIGAGGL